MTQEPLQSERSTTEEKQLLAYSNAIYLVASDNECLLHFGLDIPVKRSESESKVDSESKADIERYFKIQTRSIVSVLISWDIARRLSERLQEALEAHEKGKQERSAATKDIKTT